MGLPFSILLRPGRAVHDQLVFAVTKAIVMGQLRTGDRFPSVRALSQELRINPNTAQKAVSTLADQGLLVVQPGVGTLVSTPRSAPTTTHRAALRDRIERLVIDARRLGLDADQLVDLIRRAWK